MDDLNSNDAPYRRRGRPSGKNRIPLSLDERRARNAQYERERRFETSEGMSHLAEAAGCDPNLINAEILATVISQLQRASKHPSDDIQELKRCNEKLIKQIEAIEKRLCDWEGTRTTNENENTVDNNRKRKCNKEGKPSKRKKTESENSLDTPLTTLSNTYNK